MKLELTEKEIKNWLENMGEGELFALLDNFPGATGRSDSIGQKMALFYSAISDEAEARGYWEPTYYISQTHHSLHDIATSWQPCDAKTLQGAKRKALQRGSYLDHAVHVGIESGREDENGAKEITTIATRPDCRRGTKWQNLN